MELIYLYLGNIDRPLKNQGIQFGRNFKVTYNPESRELIITKRKNVKPCIYGGNIQNLDLLVGQNGTGKSTILDLLGLPRSSRQDFLPFTSTNSAHHTWFAIYHIQDDLFSVEGYCANMLKFLNSDNIYWQPLYSAAFHYDVKKQCILSHPQFLQFIPDIKDAKRSAANSLFYVLYEPEPSLGWYNNFYNNPQSDPIDDFTYQRIYAAHNGYDGITQYLHNSIQNKGFSSKMSSKPGTKIIIQVQSADKSFDSFSNDEEISKLLYGNQISFVTPYTSSIDPFTYKQKMVLIYLEALVCYYIVKKKKIPPKIYQGENTYFQRRKYLLDLLKIFDHIEYSLIEEITSGIEEIPNHYFVKNDRAVIPLHSMPKKNFLSPLAQALDNSYLWEEHEINHRYFVRMSFSGISTGEAQYLDLYAALYNAFKIYPHSKGDTCILLLDEPDCRFHPEWSRKLILNLTELLQTDIFQDYQYQVIISTHSPILVSDVPKESIHCLFRDKNGCISVKRSRHGLMSNLDNLMVDSFFVESVFGAFSEQYVEALIKDIKAIKRQKGGLSKEQAENICSRLKWIENPVLKDSLNRILHRLEIKNN